MGIRPLYRTQAESNATIIGPSKSRSIAVTSKCEIHSQPFCFSLTRVAVTKKQINDK